MDKITITGYSEKEVNARVADNLGRDANLYVKIKPMLLQNGRQFVTEKWIAVLGKIDETKRRV